MSAFAQTHRHRHKHTDIDTDTRYRDRDRDREDKATATDTETDTRRRHRHGDRCRCARYPHGNAGAHVIHMYATQPCSGRDSSSHLCMKCTHFMHKCDHEPSTSTLHSRMWERDGCCLVKIGTRQLAQECKAQRLSPKPCTLSTKPQP